MKFLALSSCHCRGGAEEYLLNIGKSAIAQNWDVHFAFPQVDATAALIKDVKAQDISYHPLNLVNCNFLNPSGFGSLMQQVWATCQLLRQLKPDAVMIVLSCPDQCVAGILACALLNYPTVLVFQLFREVCQFNGIRQAAYAWARSRQQKLVSVSQHNANLVTQSFQVPAQEIAIIHNGVDLPQLTQKVINTAKQVSKTKILNETGFPEDSFLAVTVGRLSTQKGYQYIIPAMPALIKKHPNLRFVWVGEGECRAEFEADLDRLGMRQYVYFAGYQAEVSAYLAAADLFLFPTVFEGLPFALLEAMAFKRPIVASDASSLPEIITHQTHGLLIESGNIAQLEAQVTWAIEHPEAMQTMAHNAGDRVQEFTQERMVTQTLQLLETMASQPKVLHAAYS
jgi:glycosyltransferase involved in cell wall biosynthesis